MKRLVVCCDGTWNKPDQPYPTNVAKVGCGIASQDSGGVRQRVHYHPGVGTGRFERLRGGAFGLGLSRNVRECYRFLVEHYESGDELYFFGFSRGAFTARSTIGLLRNAGILRPEHVDRVDAAYDLYRKRGEPHSPSGNQARIFQQTYSHETIDVHFAGVWDTVGSLGIPGLRGPIANRWWGFHDTELSSRVRNAYQALAIDEQRRLFPPTIWHQQQDAEGQAFEQRWFAGVHCDVGGGYADPSVAELALLWLVAQARECGLAFKPEHFLEVTPAPDSARRRTGEHVAPDALGTIGDSRKGFYRLFAPWQRELRDLDGNAHLDLAPSVVERRRERSDYRPENLERYIDSRQQQASTGGSVGA